MIREYHKIETIFNRDVKGTKKLIEGDYRNETVEMLRNIPWVITEKIDGTNIRVCWDGHRVELAGRTDRAQIPSDLVNYLNSTFCTLEAEELFEQKFGSRSVTLYGEGYGKKIQKNGSLYRPDDVAFIMFDVMAGDVWLKRESIEDIGTCFGVEVVPILGRMTLPEAVEYVKARPMSTIGNAPMEGVVAKPENDLFDRLGNRLVVKIKACDFAK